MELFLEKPNNICNTPHLYSIEFVTFDQNGNVPSH